MPLLDLSLVTGTLLRLLRLRVNPLWASLFPPLPPPPTVSYTSAPSANATGEQTLGLFLYHVNEDAHFKNQPPYYRDQPPIRFAPMGLQLQYQLYAHAADGDIDSIMTRTQRLFGLALKTLHDYPSLDRSTQIGPDFVFVPELQGTDNILRIVLKGVSASDATNFWNAGTQNVRLAAYYEVGATLLEPDRPMRGSGRVLRYGVQMFVHGAPRLDTSRGTVTFRIPGETLDRTAEVQPGEAAIGENIQFDGTDLNGDATTLLIRRGDWDDAEEVGAEWGVIAGEDTIFAQVQDRAGAQAVVPGIYTAAARVTRNRRMPDGSTRAFPQASNAVPFTVAPSITNPAHNAIAVAAANVVTVTGGVFQHAAVPPEDVRVIVGGEPVPIEPSPALTPGHFEIVSPTQLRFQFPIGALTSGAVLPLRIIVNGAENAPRWVQVP